MEEIGFESGRVMADLFNLTIELGGVGGESSLHEA